MKLHLVGGFLGSGKTTAIIGAAKHLMARGQRVGVVTNDQGKYLVDTAFVRLADVPAVEVTGGCFCCNYEDLEEQLDRLYDLAQPHTVFAESVGSCADLVATVVKPMLELTRGQLQPSSFSVFADARLLRRHLLGIPLPFSENVVYLFEKQLEEGGLLVLNKADLLAPSERQEVEALARQRFPEKPMRAQNSLDADSVAGWLRLLESGSAYLPQSVLEINYQRYGDGEACLAWLDEEIILTAPADQGRAVVVELITRIQANLRQRNLPVGHLKFLVRSGSQHVKVSFPTLEVDDWQADIPLLSATPITVLVNARVEGEAETLRTLVQEAAQATAAATGAQVAESAVAAFHPGFPKPRHRLE